MFVVVVARTLTEKCTLVFLSDSHDDILDYFLKTISILFMVLMFVS